MSCNEISKYELLKTIPVNPPKVNRKINPFTHNNVWFVVSLEPYNLYTQLKILIPVGTAIIIVAMEKYNRVSTSNPTVNIWCAQTKNPNNPIDLIA